MTVVVDRYYYSGGVYSVAKEIPGLDLMWARWPEVGLPRPDLCIFLDIPEAEARKRGGYGAERYENDEMQGRVRRLFEEIRTEEQDRFRVVDAARSEDQVADEMLQVVLEILERAKRGELDAGLEKVPPPRN